MKKTILLSIATLSAAGLFAQGPRVAGRFGMGGLGMAGPGGNGVFSRAVVTGMPFSATVTYQSQQTLAGGNQINNSEQEKIYRDSQGRTRVERTVTPPASSGQAAFTEITITDPLAGYRYMLNSSTMTEVQMPLPKPPSTSTSGTPRTPPSRPNGPQITTTSLGTQTINGVLSTGTQRTETIPAGAIGNAQPIQVVRLRWVSNDLKIPVEIKTSDPRSGTSDMEVTNIVQSEPAASLFVVPSGYTLQTGRGGRGPGIIRGNRRFGGNPQ